MNKWLRLFLLGALIGVGSTIFAQRAIDHKELKVIGFDHDQNLVIDGDKPETWNKEGFGRCVSIKGSYEDFYIVCRNGKLKLYRVTTSNGLERIESQNVNVQTFEILERQCGGFVPRVNSMQDLGFAN